MNTKAIARLVLDAGWEGADAVTAVAVVLAESGGNELAVSKTGRYKGLWQFSPDHPVRPFDPKAATAYARKLWLRSGFSPWTAYLSGKYRIHLPIARQATEAAVAELRA